MKQLTLAVILLTIFSISSCIKFESLYDNPAADYWGKWEIYKYRSPSLDVDLNGEVTFEFFEDNTLKIQKFEGDSLVLDLIRGYEIEWDWLEINGQRNEVYSISKNEMILEYAQYIDYWSEYGRSYFRRVE